MGTNTVIAADTETRKPQNKKVFIGIFLLVIGISIAVGVTWWNQLRTSIKTENARVCTDIVDISFRTAGQVKCVHVKEGNKVKQGDDIAKLDDASYQLAFDQAQAGLALAEANYNKLPYDIKSMKSAVDKAQIGVAFASSALKNAELTLQDAQRNLQRQQILFDSGSISQTQLDAASLAYDRSQEAVNQAKANLQTANIGVIDSQQKLQATMLANTGVVKAQLDSAQASAANAKLNLNNTVIKSPVNGSVLRLSVVNGENVNPGQAVVSIADLSSTWITANIEEKKASRVKMGQRVDVKIDSYPGKVFKGKVVSISDASQSTFAIIPGENTSGNFTKVVQRIPVKIELDDHAAVLKPGMSVFVRIYTAS